MRKILLVAMAALFSLTTQVAWSGQGKGKLDKDSYQESVITTENGDEVHVTEKVTTFAGGLKVDQTERSDGSFYTKYYDENGNLIRAISQQPDGGLIYFQPDGSIIFSPPPQPRQAALLPAGIDIDHCAGGRR